jgi:hypothetical protein
MPAPSVDIDVPAQATARGGPDGPGTNLIDLKPVVTARVVVNDPGITTKAKQCNVWFFMFTFLP